MSNPRNILAKNLERLIETSGKEKQQIARDLGVSPSIVSMWVSGKRYPRPDIQKKIADYFHITVSDLVDDMVKEESPAYLSKADMDFLEKIRRSPGMRTLLDATKEATNEEIQQYTNLIKALRKNPYDDD